MKITRLCKTWLLAVLSLVNTLVSQCQDTAEVRKRINVLASLSEKDLHYTVMDNDMHPQRYINLGLSKEQFLKMDSSDYKTYNWALFLVYYFYVLKQEHKHFNEVGTLLGIAKDTVSSQYYTPFNLGKVDPNAYTWQQRIGSLLLLSPYAAAYYLVDGNLVINFQENKPFTPEEKVTCEAYSSWCSIIISKYLMQPRDGIKKIISVWIDSKKDWIKFETATRTKEYQTYLKRF